jgi:hypothetical protein
MKKVSILVLTGLILAAIVFVGCSDKTVQSVQKQTNVQDATKKPFKKWTQDTYPAVSKDDPITFYNEFEIRIEAKVPKQIMMFKDGVTYYVDSSMVVSLTIDKETPGVLVTTEPKNGPVKIMEVSFDATDPDYNIRFFVQNDKSYAQDERCKITYEGIKYEAKAVVVSNKESLNYLLSDFEWLDLSSKKEGRAGGRNATGTKIVKQK